MFTGYYSLRWDAFYWMEKEITHMGYKETARRLGVVAQHNAYDFDFLVKDIVLMGRSPHKRTMDRDTAEDYAMMRDALRQVGMERFENRSFPAFLEENNSVLFWLVLWHRIQKR